MFVKDWPLVSSSDVTSGVVSGSTEQMRENWSSLQRVISGEHVSMTTSTTSGYHKAGQFAVISYAPASACTGDAGGGALAWTSNTGTLYVYRDQLSSLSAEDTTGWRPTGAAVSGCCSVRAVLTTEQEISSGTVTIVKPWKDNSGSTYDMYSEFNVTTGLFIPNATGYYLCIGKVRWDIEDINDGMKTNARHWAALSGAGGATYYGYDGAWGDGEISTEIADIVKITGGDKLAVVVGHEDSEVKLHVVGASIHFHRLY